jgi:hypothetical protein
VSPSRPTRTTFRPGSAGDTDFALADILGKPFAVKRLYIRVTTAITTAPAALTVIWRPVVGSATGAVTLGVVAVPVSVAGETFEADFERMAQPAGVAHASQPADAAPHLIGSQELFTARGVTQLGPNGEIRISNNDAPGAGAIELWVEVQSLPFVDPMAKPVTAMLTPTAA